MDSAAAARPRSALDRSHSTTGPEGRVDASPQPGLRPYAGGHHNLLNRRSQPQPDSTAGDEAFVEVWGALTANGGTFAVSGDTVRSKAFVAMDPAVMAADRIGAVRTWRIQGDTLWLTDVSNQGEPVANPTTATFVRAR